MGHDAFRADSRARRRGRWGSFSPRRPGRGAGGRRHRRRQHRRRRHDARAAHLPRPRHGRCTPSAAPSTRSAGGAAPARRWTVKEELAAYGAEPDWFGLGDRDLATHLVRTRMLDAGYPLSAVTAALADRWQPGVTLLPMSDQRVETHVVVTTRRPAGPRRCTSRSGGSGTARRCEPAAFVQVGVDDARPAPGVAEAFAAADAVLLAPSNPVVSVGTILGVPGLRAALLATPGASPASRRSWAERSCAAWPTGACRPSASRSAPRASAGTTAAARRGGLLDAWLVHTGDAGRGARRRRPRRAAAHVLSRGDRRARPRRPGRRRCLSAVPDEVSVRARRAGCRSSRPGDDLAAAIAAAVPASPTATSSSSPRRSCRRSRAGWCRSPPGADREAARQKAVRDETVRVLARRGPLSIVQTRQGWVVAAAGVDASNVGQGSLVLLPVDADASARALRDRLARPARGRRRRGRQRHLRPHLARGAHRRRRRVGRGARAGRPPRRRRRLRQPAGDHARSPWSTSSPRPPTWSRASSPGCRWRWSAACRSSRRPATRAPGRCVRDPADDLFPYGARDLVGARAPAADLVPRAGEREAVAEAFRVAGAGSARVPGRAALRR